MERPPNADTSQGYQISQGRPWIVPFEVWVYFNPCPDGEEGCARCGIDYATYLSSEAILNGNA